MNKILQVVWERLSLYLPVILMGILALGTYWLVRSTPLPMTPEQEAPPRHEPDYFMRNFSVKTFDGEGRLKSEVLGVNARHYPDTDSLEIESVSIHSFNEEGRLTTATAGRGVTNGDASEVQLIGKAHVVREQVVDKTGQSLPRLEYRGEFLHAFMKTEQIKSHLPVVLVHGLDQFTADSMDYDNLERVMQLKGRVKGVLVPTSSK
ncbi:MAG: LPS export ABC transporter periplasmic protein LptC [Rhodoferax sp.]|uniref:LPS export ABC transporter periplasmic protein LptC n=1 Tax=Rhodoferax sp. TaxID=50421 RepID=UPI0030193E86